MSRRTASFTLAGVLALAAIVAGSTSALSLTIVLTFAVVFAFPIVSRSSHAGLYRCEGFRGERTSIEAGESSGSNDQSS